MVDSINYSSVCYNCNHIDDLCNCKHITMYNNVIKQLSEIKLKHIKVCKNCNEIGHNIKSINCKINIENNNKYIKKIKDYILSLNPISNISIDQHLETLSIELNITFNMCKTLYKQIPPMELCNTNIDLNEYIENIKENIILCNDCGKNIYNIHQNTNHIWKNNILCDSCWGNYEEERKTLWKNIEKYITIKCAICNKTKTNKYMRFHFDHLNMFDKNNSICAMVNTGENLKNIFKELHKCQVLCLTCHHMVTDIENKLLFTRIKSLLTRKLNNNEISEDDYYNEINKLSTLYENTMLDIYNKLKILYSN